MESRINVLWMFIMLFLFTTSGAYAQSFAEFFSQKKTQKKYLLSQIAALQVYTGYVRDGYNIASSGLETVRGFTNGEFNLHNAFISSLKKVSPQIRNHVKVAEIIGFQLAIGNLFNALEKDSEALLTIPHKEYINAVNSKVIKDCSKDMEELLLVITSGKVEMTEDEHLKRLDKVYTSMRDRSAFTQYFASEVNIFIGQKKGELKSVNQIQDIYETKY